MHTEYEIKVLEIDALTIKRKLAELNATFKGDFEQKRFVYDFKPIVSGKWIRLRTNGKKTTLTIKEVTSKQVDGTRELEIAVDNFDSTHLILKELGYEERAYQENRRSSYSLNDCDIEIDTWPLIPTYMEIEGPSEEIVYETLALLGIDQEKATSLDVESIYNEIYNININDINHLKFDN